MGVSAFAATNDQDSAIATTVTYGKATQDGRMALTVKLGGEVVETAPVVIRAGESAGSVAAKMDAAISAVLPADYGVTTYVPADNMATLALLTSGNVRSEIWKTAGMELTTGDGASTVYDNSGAYRTSGGNIANPNENLGRAPIDWQEDWTQIIYPYALVEDGDYNVKDGVLPNKSVYFMVYDEFADPDDFKIDVSKGENPKVIKKISVIEKKFDKGLVRIGDVRGTKVEGTTKRTRYIKIELNENMTDSEFKISFDMKVKVDNKDGVSIWDGTKWVVFDKGDASKKFEDIGRVWVANDTDTTDDTEFMAGTGGIVIKPVKNEENTVLWTDENRDLARLTFVADSDVAKYFPKLSTKWPNATYAQLFDDQDAFVFDFVGNPKISSTSRAVLELFCPFLDADDEYSIDPESVVIYQVADDATLAASTEVELARAILDGRLIDVTDKFTAGENEDGDFVYTTKTRTLGTYIIAEKAPSEEAFEEAEGEAPGETPADDTGKTNPGTGR